MPEPTEYLTTQDLLVIASGAIRERTLVRDYGLLDSPANRPRASVFGRDAYPSIHLKAAALLQSVVRNHALVDGNKHTGWLATVVFYDLNGYELEAPDDDQPVVLVLRVATDHPAVEDIEDIVTTLARWANAR